MRPNIYQGQNIDLNTLEADVSLCGNWYMQEMVEGEISTDPHFPGFNNRVYGAKLHEGEVKELLHCLKG